MRPRTFTRLGWAGAMLTLAATAALAQPLDRQTYFTFNAPTAIPGVTLPAGKYLFRVADVSSRNVVQVLNQNGTKVYSSFFVLRAERTEPARDSEIRFMETATGMPSAVRTWWYPGERRGYEFVYPKNQARLLAKGTGQPVLTTEAVVTAPPAARPPEFARVTPSGEEILVQTEPMPEEIVGPSLIGEAARPPAAVPETVQARAELPKTASNTPFLALTGMLLLMSAALVRRWRLSRG